jgi:nucleoside-diphosphate-sugar epimerase
MLPNPISPYAVAKLAGEHYMRVFARVYGLETVVLRYFNVFGPYQDPTSHYSGVLAIFCRRMLAGEQPTIYGDGEQSRDFTYIDNVVHANLLAAAAPAEKVSGQMMNAGHRLAHHAERDVWILRELTGYSGKPAYAHARRGYPRLAGRYWAGGELLGYEPRSISARGLRRTVEWYRDGAASGLVRGSIPGQMGAFPQPISCVMNLLTNSPNLHTAGISSQRLFVLNSRDSPA